jgi:tRNA pseudouridine38-40 synthase
MPRYRLVLEYDGRPYNGYQAQEGLPTIQAAIEKAILGFCGEAVRIQAAGRTDAGVHATGQVIHVDLTRDWPAAVVRDAMNAHLLGEAVVVLESEKMETPFHARFDAGGRRYLYRILNRKTPPALDKGKVWHVKKPLDAEAMHAAAQILVGHHDFTTFRDLACQANSPVKTMDLIRVWREGEEVRLEFASRSFLHRQVRSMTGSIAEVGVGRWTADQLRAALEARDRRACGPVAPADGLYLTGVSYEKVVK